VSVSTATGAVAERHSHATVQCFNVGTTSALSEKDASTVAWLLRETYEPGNLITSSALLTAHPNSTVVEVGPRLTFSTAWSANAVSVCTSVGISTVTRIEKSRRYVVESTGPLSDADKVAFEELVHDRMTEEVYRVPLTSFKVLHCSLLLPWLLAGLVWQGSAGG
jgi:phosphoribosylformylglycinamidine synthase